MSYHQKLHTVPCSYLFINA